jgi:DNA-binding NarL/FixJ family response regulator
MIASGKTLTEIAEELKLSVKTVSVYGPACSRR